jgi:hypothetical protein
VARRWSPLSSNLTSTTTAAVDTAPPIRRIAFVIKSRADARTNLPPGARWSAKCDAALTGNQAGKRQPSSNGGLRISGFRFALGTALAAASTPRIRLRATLLIEPGVACPSPA